MFSNRHAMTRFSKWNVKSTERKTWIHKQGIEKSLYSIFDWFKSQTKGWIVHAVACDWLTLPKCPASSCHITKQLCQKTWLSLGWYNLVLFDGCRWLRLQVELFYWKAVSSILNFSQLRRNYLSHCSVFVANVFISLTVLKLNQLFINMKDKNFKNAKGDLRYYDSSDTPATEVCSVVYGPKLRLRAKERLLTV